MSYKLVITLLGINDPDTALAVRELMEVVYG